MGVLVVINIGTKEPDDGSTQDPCHFCGTKVWLTSDQTNVVYDEGIDVQTVCKEHNPLNPIWKISKQNIAAVVRRLIDNVVVDIPSPEQGDFAVACFAHANKTEKSPIEVAQYVADKLNGNGLSNVYNIVANGGYVNFCIKPEVLKEIVNNIGPSYGIAKPNGVRVLVEHTSANPTGPLHVGRARNPIIGDSLARLLKTAGYSVSTEYYVNDMGKQVATMVWGLQHGLSYQQASNTPNEQEIAKLLQEFENGEHKDEFQNAVNAVLDKTKKTLTRLNVNIDSWVFESKFVFDGDVANVLKSVREHVLMQNDGIALFVDVEGEKLFLTRSDGTSLYALRDLAYHTNKGNRADVVVNVVGEDHKRAMAQLGNVLQRIGIKPPECVFYSFVGLHGGKKMSTRDGTAITMDDVMTEAVIKAKLKLQENLPKDEPDIETLATKIGVGALRFSIVKMQPDRAIEFDVNESLAFDGATAPYIQYANARILSLLRKANDIGIGVGKDVGVLNEHTEIDLMRVLVKYPALVTTCAEERKVYPIALYAIELAKTFTSFYHDCDVFGNDATASRLKLCEAVHETLTNATNILGIELPERM